MLIAILFAYGVAGVVGNFLAGITAARYTTFTLIMIAAGLVLTPLLFITTGQSVTGGGGVLIFWGLAYGGLSVGLMTWMMKAAPRDVEIAAAFYVGVSTLGLRWDRGAGADRRYVGPDRHTLVGLRVSDSSLAFGSGRWPESR